MEKKNIEKKIVAIATFLVNAQTVNGVAETMNRIAVLIDGYSEKTSKYFTGLYTHIDSNDRAFQPLDDYENCHVKRLGAMLILSPTMSDAVNTLVRLHNMLKWDEGKEAMIEMTNRLYDVADSME
jgi:hypothetical protein